MNLAVRSMILLALFLLINNDKKESVEATNVIVSFVRDLLQNNLAGLPVTHQRTEWNFDPETGKKRRSAYEKENGHRGEIAIAKLGMGIG
ncbi:hypothetical protein KPH14_004267 [Odynerus spinipes]|uniref:Uncharacterized protein n=1 Tax=Odynerus spinipes TaxID=1348599 RepID=A0AAD9RYD7_9HYME|nr:hypothetical protein KPH14_004267 [Odynerus spinipes]